MRRLIETKTISDLIGNTPESIRNWIKSKRPIIGFLSTYFTNEDIKEYLDTNNISRIDTLFEYEEICNCIKKELNAQCQELIKNKNQSFIDFGLYLDSLDKKECVLGPIKSYSTDLFLQLLMQFNGHLIESNNQRFIKTLAEVESFYFSLKGTAYKYYFHKELMWTFTQGKKRNQSRDIRTK